MCQGSDQRRRLGPAATGAALLCAWLSSALGPAAAATGVSEPAAGQWAPTTLALLHHGRHLCDGIAGDVLAYWARLGNGGANRQQAVRDHVLHSAVSELAAARAAGDLVRRFLPRAKDEVGRETGASLERLSGLQTELCDMVALPTAPYASFETSVGELSERIDRERAELGRLLVVPEEALQRALEPYLVHIQLAGVKAEGELIDYLNSLKPEVEPPTKQELMEAWHRTYAPRAQPVKAALGKFLAGRRSGDRRQLSEGCRELTAAVLPLLDAEGVLDPPDRGAAGALRRTYTHMQRLAVSCTSGKFQDVDKSFGLMQQELQIAAEELAEFSLVP